MLVVTHNLRIPLAEFEFTFARSSGPGGQNVNKVSSKAMLRWPVVASPSLSEPVRGRLLAKYRRRVTAEGHLLVASQRFRDAGRNVADCLDKLRAMLLEVATAPKARRPSRPTRASIRRRLDAKQKQSQKKQGRRTPREE
jgi:ribosome-associated protein